MEDSDYMAVRCCYLIGDELHVCGDMAASCCHLSCMHLARWRRDIAHVGGDMVAGPHALRVYGSDMVTWR